MPLEAKPLFRPDVLRTHLGAFALPDRVEAAAPKLGHWAELLSSRRADSFKEQEILPDFLTDFFCGVLGYTRPADGQPGYTISREKHVQVDGKYADAVLGAFNGEPRYFVALEGKGPRDPLDRPFAGRRMSAVDQASVFSPTPPGLNRSSTLATRSRFSKTPTSFPRSSSPGNRPPRRSPRPRGYARFRASSFALMISAGRSSMKGWRCPMSNSAQAPGSSKQPAWARCSRRSSVAACRWLSSLA